MKACTRILSAAIAAWLCMAGWTFAQVEPEGEMSLLVKQDLLVPPSTSDANDFVFRNRLGGMMLTATADIMAMSRNGNQSFTLLQNGQGGPEALNAKDLDFEMRTGPRLGLIIHGLLLGNGLELGYMSIDGYSLSKTTYSDTSPLYFESPLVNGIARDGAGIRFDYRSRITSTEANLRHEVGERLAFLAGFRYVDLHEQMDGTFTMSGQSDMRFITSNTDNHLYGFQIGAKMAVINLQKIRLGGGVKAGIFSNQADLTLYGDDPSRAVGGRQGQLAFLGEAEVTGSYLITDNLAVRLGYQAMWLQGVGLAVDQLEMPSRLDQPGWYPNTGGNLFYHGAFLGVEFSF